MKSACSWPHPFTSDDWDRVHRDWSAWWAGELDRPMAVIESAPPAAAGSMTALSKYGVVPREMPAEEVLDIIEGHLQSMRWYGDAFPRWFPNLGPGIIAGFLGSGVHPTRETAWFDPLLVANIQDLDLRYDGDNLWWRRTKELTAMVVERWGSEVCIAHTDIGQNLDILLHLRGSQQLLLDACDMPEEVVRHFLSEVERAHADHRPSIAT